MRLLVFLGGLALLLYLGSYIILSRRGYAEADQYKLKGFYYFTPVNSDSCRFWNTACVFIYTPLNEVDCKLGIGKPPAYEPLWGLSR